MPKAKTKRVSKKQRVVKTISVKQSQQQFHRPLIPPYQAAPIAGGAGGGGGGGSSSAVAYPYPVQAPQIYTQAMRGFNPHTRDNNTGAPGSGSSSGSGSAPGSSSGSAPGPSEGFRDQQRMTKYEEFKSYQDQARTEMADIKNLLDRWGQSASELYTQVQNIESKQANNSSYVEDRLSNLREAFGEVMNDVSKDVEELNTKTVSLTDGWRQTNEAVGGMATQLRTEFGQRLQNVYEEAGGAYQQVRSDLEERKKEIAQSQELSVRNAAEATAINYKLMRMAEDIGSLTGDQQQQIAGVAAGLQNQFQALEHSLHQQYTDRQMGATALTGLAQQIATLEDQIREVRDGQRSIYEIQRSLQEAVDSTSSTVAQLTQANDDISTLTPNTELPNAYQELGRVPPTVDPPDFARQRYSVLNPSGNAPLFNGAPAQGSVWGSSDVQGQIAIVGPTTLAAPSGPQPVGQTWNNGTYAGQTTDQTAPMYTDALAGMQQLQQTYQDGQMLAYAQYGGQSVVEAMTDLRDNYQAGEMLAHAQYGGVLDAMGQMQETVQSAAGLLGMADHLDASQALLQMGYMRDPSNDY